MKYSFIHGQKELATFEWKHDVIDDWNLLMYSSDGFCRKWNLFGGYGSAFKGELSPFGGHPLFF